MVTVGVNDSGTITIAGKSATQRKSDPEQIVIEEIVGIRINGIEEAEDLVCQLLHAIRKEAYEKGISYALHNMTSHGNDWDDKKRDTNGCSNLL